MKHRVVLVYQTDTGPNFAALIVETAETDALPGSERWLTQLEGVARKTLSSRDVLILSWQLLVEEPECSAVECLPAPAMLALEHCCGDCLYLRTGGCNLLDRKVNASTIGRCGKFQTKEKPPSEPVKDHCSRCLLWCSRHCPDGRPAPGSQDACKLFKPKL